MTNRMEGKERFTFGRQQKLKSRKDIGLLFQSREAVNKYPILAKYQVVQSPVDQLYFPKVAVTVSKRSFKKAVDRNRIKRLLRETYRLHANELKSILTEKATGMNICFIYLAKRELSYAEVERGMKVILTDLVTKVTVDE